MCVFIISVVHLTIHTFQVANTGGSRGQDFGTDTPASVSDIIGLETENLVKIAKEGKGFGAQGKNALEALVRLNCMKNLLGC